MQRACRRKNAHAVNVTAPGLKICPQRIRVSEKAYRGYHYEEKNDCPIAFQALSKRSPSTIQAHSKQVHFISKPRYAACLPCSVFHVSHYRRVRPSTPYIILIKRTHKKRCRNMLRRGAREIRRVAREMASIILPRCLFLEFYPRMCPTRMYRNFTARMCPARMCRCPGAADVNARMCPARMCPCPGAADVSGILPRGCVPHGCVRVRGLRTCPAAAAVSGYFYCGSVWRSCAWVVKSQE